MNKTIIFKKKESVRCKIFPLSNIDSIEIRTSSGVHPTTNSAYVFTGRMLTECVIDDCEQLKQFIKDPNSELIEIECDSIKTVFIATYTKYTNNSGAHLYKIPEYYY